MAGPRLKAMPGSERPEGWLAGMVWDMFASPEAQAETMMIGPLGSSVGAAGRGSGKLIKHLRDLVKRALRSSDPELVSNAAGAIRRNSQLIGEEASRKTEDMLQTHFEKLRTKAKSKKANVQAADDIDEAVDTLVRENTRLDRTGHNRFGETRLDSGRQGRETHTQYNQRGSEDPLWRIGPTSGQVRDPGTGASISPGVRSSIAQENIARRRMPVFNAQGRPIGGQLRTGEGTVLRPDRRLGFSDKLTSPHNVRRPSEVPRGLSRENGIAPSSPIERAEGELISELLFDWFTRNDPHPQAVRRVTQKASSTGSRAVEEVSEKTEASIDPIANFIKAIQSSVVQNMVGEYADDIVRAAPQASTLPFNRPFGPRTFYRPSLEEGTRSVVDRGREAARSANIQARDALAPEGQAILEALIEALSFLK